MCESCRNFALSMVSSAQRGGQQIGSRAPTSVIPKFNFKLTRLPTSMLFSHACSRSPEDVQSTGGFDPAFSSEICYNGDTDAGHERWYDRMMFAAQKREGRWLSKVAELRGYGTETLAQGGHQYTYEFEAPAGTIVRSTDGGFDGEVCFPEPIPYAWITYIHEVQQPAPKQRRAFILRYQKPPPQPKGKEELKKN